MHGQIGALHGHTIMDVQGVERWTKYSTLRVMGKEISRLTNLPRPVNQEVQKRVADRYVKKAVINE